MKILSYVFSLLLILTSCSEESATPELEFTRIPAGSFNFGTDNGKESEGPSVRCHASEFHLSTTEVSNEQFEAFVNETGYVTHAEKSGGFVFDGSWQLVSKANWRTPKGRVVNYNEWKNLPVVQVSYSDALAYCKWAECRLPTEIEWEHAANLGQLDLMKANFIRPGRNLPHIEKTNERVKDQLGIYHQLGNVWEWCADVYNSEVHDKMDGGFIYLNGKGGFQGRSYDPEKMNTDTLRVIKGGSFLCQKGHCEGYRPEARQSAEQHEAYFHIGFRVARD